MGNQDCLLGPKEQATTSTVSASTYHLQGRGEITYHFCRYWNLNPDMKPTTLLSISF